MLRFSGKLIIASLLALVLPSSSRGQTTFPTANGSSVPGAVMMCVDSATGLAAPVLVSGSTCPSGSGGGGGGAITAASGAYAAGSIASGAMVDLGVIADAASSAGGTGTVSAKLRLITTQLGTINTTLGSPFQAGGTITANLGTLNGAATAANQTNASQKSQIVDGSGNVIASTSNALNVQVANANTNGQATMANSSPAVLASNQSANALWGHVATGAAPPANITYVGGNGSGATGGQTRAGIICDLHALYTGSDNGSKTLVAGVSGRKTYICGWLLSTAASATTLTLFKGTDADCATSGAAIGPPYSLLANDRVGVNSPTWNGFVTATNADYVCINAGAGNAHTAEIWYAIL